MCAKVSHIEWDTEAMDEENILWDASQANDDNQETISIISNLSEDEDVPTADQNTLNNFLQKAMNMEESLKRGTNGSAKASYAVRVGQKQARRTVLTHSTQKGGFGGRLAGW